MLVGAYLSQYEVTGDFYLSLLKIFQIHAQGKKLNSTGGLEMKNTVSHPTPFNPRPIS